MRALAHKHIETFVWTRSRSTRKSINKSISDDEKEEEPKLNEQWAREYLINRIRLAGKRDERNDNKQYADNLRMSWSFPPFDMASLSLSFSNSIVIHPFMATLVYMCIILSINDTDQFIEWTSVEKPKKTTIIEP